MATFTLEDLKNEVSKKYAPTVIKNGTDEYVLQNLLQLPSKKRNQTMDLVETIDSEEEEKSGIDHQVGVFREIIKVVVANDRGQDLLGLLGDNDALVIELVSAWMDSSQLGEAEPSSK